MCFLNLQYRKRKQEKQKRNWNSRNIIYEYTFVSGELLSEDTDQIEIVAIKVLKDSATREAEEDFLREVEIMSAFRHPNILSLLGVVLRGE